MGYIDKTNGFDKLIQFSSGNVIISDFPEIKRSIEALFKEIYGDDIDLSTASADGIFVYNISLMINNLLRAFKQLSNNLDVDLASGIYLDNLCKLSNITRKTGVNSTVSIKIKNVNSEAYRNITELNFLDINGNIWQRKYDILDDINLNVDGKLSIEPNDTIDLIATCLEPGPVVANAGDIQKLFTTEYDLEIISNEAAVLGSFGETDNELRIRRSKSLGSSGNSVLESLIGLLSQLSDIEDVKIYNNDSNGNISTKGGLSIPRGSICIFLKKKHNALLNSAVIGSMLYEKMTVGVNFFSSTGFTKFNYKSSYLGTSVNEYITQIVAWKECDEIHPEIKVKLNAYSNLYVDGITGENIGRTIISYLNSLSIGTDLNMADLYNVVLNADPKANNSNTYYLMFSPGNSNNFISIANDFTSLTYSNNDNIYYYDKLVVDETGVPNAQGIKEIIITISKES